MRSEHLDRLRDAMAPDPAEWTFTERVRDTGSPTGSRCTCGHPIRYEFLIRRRRDGATLVIGSRCIETSVPFLIDAGATELASELRRAQIEHRRKVQAEGREVRARAALERSQADLRELVAWYRGAADRFRGPSDRPAEETGPLPDDLSEVPSPPGGEDRGRAVASIRRRFHAGWMGAIRYAHEYDDELPPWPTDDRLREQLRRSISENVNDELSEFRAASRFAMREYEELSAPP